MSSPAGRAPKPSRDDQRPSGAPSGGLGVTTARQLLVAVLAGGVLGYFVVGTFQLRGASAPMTPWSLPGLLFVLGVMGLGLAPALRRTVIEARADLSAERALQALALAKTLLLGGAIIGGGHVVYAVFFSGHWDAEGPRQRVIRGIATVICAAVMALGGRALERACRIPPVDDGAQDDPSSR